MYIVQLDRQYLSTLGDNLTKRITENVMIGGTIREITINRIRNSELNAEQQDILIKNNLKFSISADFLFTKFINKILSK